jgi:GxxExxY protein
METKDINLKYDDITKVIIGCAFEVINEIGTGFLESVYEKSMIIALREKGLNAQAQQSLKVLFRKIIVGEFVADIIVENKVIIELKAIKALLSEHKAQVINYLNATGIEVGLLINFGNPTLEFRRFTRSTK